MELGGNIEYHVSLGTEVKNNLKLQYELAWQNSLSEKMLNPTIKQLIVSKRYKILYEFLSETHTHINF